MKQFTAGANDDGVRLSRFVQKVTHNLPNSHLYKSFRKRRIKINGRPAAPDTRIITGDLIELYINDEFFDNGSNCVSGSEVANESASTKVRPSTPLQPFEVVYQTEGFAVLYKPSGVLSHSDAPGVGNLLDSFTQLLIDAGEYQPKEENVFSPALCNRLDRGTEGLILAAKQAWALRGLNEIIRAGLLEKTYRCICLGIPPEGVHTAYLTRDKQIKTVTVTADETSESKQIITGVTVLESCGPYSYCEIKLFTGRTHQIRAHLEYLGTPLLGDRKYGVPTAIWQNHKRGLMGQALCAWRLDFAQVLPKSCGLQPVAGMSFKAETAILPTTWRNLCSNLKK